MGGGWGVGNFPEVVEECSKFPENGPDLRIFSEITEIFKSLLRFPYFQLVKHSLRFKFTETTNLE